MGVVSGVKIVRFPSLLGEEMSMKQAAPDPIISEEVAALSRTPERSAFKSTGGYLPCHCVHLSKLDGASSIWESASSFLLSIVPHRQRWGGAGQRQVRSAAKKTNRNTSKGLQCNLFLFLELLHKGLDVKLPFRVCSEHLPSFA
ncbi:hypothetical protein BS78_03G138600 [Paspalum vaginatum]|nr:hypothetical protein BS78_03G138600 [Paspalum vaginatum]